MHRRRNQEGGGVGARAPQYFILETLLVFIHAAQIAMIAVYITFDPPKMELLPTPMLCYVQHVTIHQTHSTTRITNWNNKKSETTG